MQAVEAVTRSLRLALGADEASFLIADLSGRALVRLTHIPLSEAKASPPEASQASGASARRPRR